MKIPSKEECLDILRENNVPDNIIAHVKAVCDFSMKVADFLENKGVKVNRKLVAAGALLHDVKKLTKGDHITEGYELVKSLGFDEVALLVKRHGLQHLEDDGYEPKTWEEKIVFYADKRCNGNKVVSVDERFEYIKKRYGYYDTEKEFQFTKKVEEELFGKDVLN